MEKQIEDRDKTAPFLAYTTFLMMAGPSINTEIKAVFSSEMTIVLDAATDNRDIFNHFLSAGQEGKLTNIMILRKRILEPHF